MLQLLDALIRLVDARLLNDARLNQALNDPGDLLADVRIEIHIVAKAEHIQPGLDPETQMGPVVSAVQRDRVLGYLEKGKAEGASVVLDGGPAEIPEALGGFFVKPWLLAGSPENICCREEIFGPAAYMLKFRDEAEAVKLVNRLDYGLANSVWSADLARANRVAEQLVSGNSWINAHNVFAYGLPYGGVNRSGLGGGVNSPATFYDYLRDQTVARPLA